MSTSIPFTLPLPGGIPNTHRPHTEAKTTILVPKGNTAFLNPVQEYNRDLSVAVIRAWNELRKDEADERRRKHAEAAREKREKKERKKGEGKAETNGVDEPISAPAAGPEETAANDESPIAGPSTQPAQSHRKITILEALSATGLRSIRYAKEIPDVKYVLANDLSPSACEAMRENVDLNGVGEPSAPFDPSNDADSLAEQVGRREGCRGVVRVNEGDACSLMYQHRPSQARVDVVDLDPYGTAAPFLDAAIGCINDGGLLCVTCTDAAVLAGSQYPEKAFSNYGGVCVSAEYAHEVALRLVLNALASTAARYGRYITPLLSFSIDFYVRLFIRVETRPEKVKQVASQIGTVYVCSYCQTPTLQPLGRIVEKEGPKGGTNRSYRSAVGPTADHEGCNQCGSSQHVGGPMWLGPIQDNDFAGRVLKGIEGQQAEYGTWARMHGMLSIAHEAGHVYRVEELANPFYFTCNRLHGLFHSSSGPTSGAISALLNAGYKVSRSHATPGAIKTDAPRSFVNDIVREYIKTNPVRMDKIADGSPARRLIEKPMTHKVSLAPHKDARKFEKGEKVVYYQVNPTANWGPAQRAKTVAARGLRKRKGEGAEMVNGGIEPGKRAKTNDGGADRGVDEKSAAATLIETVASERSIRDAGAEHMDVDMDGADEEAALNTNA